MSVLPRVLSTPALSTRVLAGISDPDAAIQSHLEVASPFQRKHEVAFGDSKTALRQSFRQYILMEEIRLENK